MLPGKVWILYKIVGQSSKAADYASAAATAPDVVAVMLLLLLLCLMPLLIPVDAAAESY